MADSKFAAPALIDVKEVAAICGFSTRHVYRIAHSGRMPRPIMLNGLIRWRREDIEQWIADGCPSGQQEGASC